MAFQMVILVHGLMLQKYLSFKRQKIQVADFKLPVTSKNNQPLTRNLLPVLVYPYPFTQIIALTYCCNKYFITQKHIYGSKVYYYFICAVFNFD